MGMCVREVKLPLQSEMTVLYSSLEEDMVKGESHVPEYSTGRARARDARALTLLF